TIFVIFYSVLFFVYPLYSVVIEYLPEIVTLRYEDARDASFGLRMRLYRLIEQDFYNSNYWDLLFGKGNEYSRLLEESEIGQDILPHNDFFRILDDWGLLGAILFFVFLYRIAKRNITSLMLSLCYLVIFYSNMVFNLFVVSILMLSSFCPPV